MRIVQTLPDWLHTRKLPDSVSLQIIDLNQRVLFSSKGKWLHPLLESQQFLLEQNIEPETVVLHDRIAGRAAAALAVHIGFAAVRATMMSRLAETVYQRYHVPYSADTIVERIACRTEDIIHDDMDLETIYELIVERALRAKEKVRSDEQ